MEKKTVPELIGVGDGLGVGGVKPSFHKIENESEAIELVKTRYQVPKNDKVVFVTSDCNVFYQSDEKFARAHHRKQNLKLFELTWD